MISIIIILHFLFDWICQSREIALTKKTSLESLIIHISFQTLPCLFSIIAISRNLEDSESALSGAMLFILVNLVTHTIIDWFLPQGSSNREIINWTAFSQTLHLVILIESYHLFLT